MGDYSSLAGHVDELGPAVGTLLGQVSLTGPEQGRVLYHASCADRPLAGRCFPA